MDSTPWKTYWQRDVSDTFGDGYTEDEILRTTIHTFLTRSFKQAQRTNNLLDLGCGNGGNFPLYRAAFPADRLPNHWYGVDYALTSEQFVADNVLFYDCDMTDLPKEIPRQDIVTSIFAAEYAKPEALVESLATVCSSGGHICFVSHTPDSVISKKSAQTVAFYDTLEDSGLTDNTRLDAGQHAFKELEQRLLSTLKGLMSTLPRAQQYDCYLVAMAIQKLVQQYGPTQDTSGLVKSLRRYSEQLKQHRARLEQQLSAAKQTSRLCNELQRSSQFSSTFEQLECQYGAIGVGIHADKKNTTSLN